ncbi:hypothetical protein [Rhizobium leguminosarum]|uniref:hypothetical protein n=1 Tax=Rhizobium leguminosarum TaxID=384 RepID=UPI001FEE1982|nr:hypothetical protein [Rhizobium leguminosarum]
MKKHPRLAGAVIAALAASPAFSGQEQFLPSEKAAAILADGVPWSALAPDGKTLKFTLK